MTQQPTVSTLVGGVALLALLAPAACSQRDDAGAMMTGVPAATSGTTFGDDVGFLRDHTSVVVLGAEGGAQVVVAPAWQGRVMTSTTRGDAGRSHGYLHRPVIALGAPQPHMTVPVAGAPASSHPY